MCTIYITAEEVGFVSVYMTAVTICTTAGETCAQCILLHGEIRDLSMYTVYTAARGDT